MNSVPVAVRVKVGIWVTFAVGEMDVKMGVGLPQDVIKNMLNKTTKMRKIFFIKYLLSI
jgi:hypothetical protein